MKAHKNLKGYFKDLIGEGGPLNDLHDSKKLYFDSQKLIISGIDKKLDILKTFLPLFATGFIASLALLDSDIVKFAGYIAIGCLVLFLVCFFLTLHLLEIRDNKIADLTEKYLEYAETMDEFIHLKANTMTALANLDGIKKLTEEIKEVVK